MSNTNITSTTTTLRAGDQVVSTGIDPAGYRTRKVLTVISVTAEGVRVYGPTQGPSVTWTLTPQASYEIVC